MAMILWALPDGRPNATDESDFQTRRKALLDAYADEASAEPSPAALAQAVETERKRHRAVESELRTAEREIFVTACELLAEEKTGSAQAERELDALAEALHQGRSARDAGRKHLAALESMVAK